MGRQDVGRNFRRIYSPQNLFSTTDPVREVVILTHGVGEEDLAKPVQCGAKLDVWDEEFVVVSFVDVGIETCGLHDGGFILGEVTRLDNTTKFFAVPPGGEVSDRRATLIEFAAQLLDGVVGSHSLTKTDRPGSFIFEGVFEMGHNDTDGA